MSKLFPSLHPHRHALHGVSLAHDRHIRRIVFLQSDLTLVFHEEPRQSASTPNLLGDQAQHPDVVTEYGIMQPGDYIGPWIWNELQAILDLCRRRVYWTPEWPDVPAPRQHTLQLGGIGGDGGDDFRNGLGGSDSSISDAKSDALADWPSGPGLTFGSGSKLSFNSSNPYYEARLWRGAARFALTEEGEAWDHRDDWTGGAPTMTMNAYLYAVAAGDQFDAYGDGVVEDQWTHVIADDVLEPWTYGWWSSIMWPDPTAGPPSPWPPDPGFRESNFRGWKIIEHDTSPIYGTADAYRPVFALVEFEYDKLTM